MITPEQVADLNAGDVVELVLRDQRDIRVVASGPLTGSSGALFLGEYAVRDMRGLPVYGDRRSLTVISRVEPPVYVNSDRTESVPGDVVRDADRGDKQTWARYSNYGDNWLSTQDGCGIPANRLPARLRLLVDGSTGQAVP